MHRKLFQFPILMVVLFIGFAYAEPTLPRADYVSPQTVKEWQKEKRRVTLIDVRSAEEFHAGHIEGAVNIPYDQIEKRAHKVNREIPAVTYCILSSWRAPYAANTLKDLGFDKVYILEGGVSAWNAGGQVVYATPLGKAGGIAPYPSGLRRNLKHPPDKSYKRRVRMTVEELSSYNGRDGRPAYVAVNGVIYDVTQSRLWRGGLHDPSHGKAAAGRDLTEVLKDSPHGDKHLKNFPVVGSLVEKE